MHFRILTLICLLAGITTQAQNDSTKTKYKSNPFISSIFTGITYGSGKDYVERRYYPSSSNTPLESSDTMSARSGCAAVIFPLVDAYKGIKIDRYRIGVTVGGELAYGAWFAKGNNPVFGAQDGFTLKLDIKGGLAAGAIINDEKNFTVSLAHYYWFWSKTHLGFSTRGKFWSRFTEATVTYDKLFVRSAFAFSRDAANLNYGERKSIYFMIQPSYRFNQKVTYFNSAALRIETASGRSKGIYQDPSIVLDSYLKQNYFTISLCVGRTL